MRELIILICWHEESDHERILVFEKNRKSFVDYNPGIEIITVMNIMSNPRDAWLSTDLSVFNWYLNTEKRAERYVIIEWDCWCDCDMNSYFSRVWDCDLVVPSIKYPERDDWVWFKTIHHLPEEARQYAVGVTPFCGILISERAMQAISREIFHEGYKGLNSELRLGTIATLLDFDPIVNPVYNRSIGWRFVSPFDRKYKGLHHPRKKITED